MITGRTIAFVGDDVTTINLVPALLCEVRSGKGRAGEKAHGEVGRWEQAITWQVMRALITRVAP